MKSNITLLTLICTLMSIMPAILHAETVQDERPHLTTNAPKPVSAPVDKYDEFGFDDDDEDDEQEYKPSWLKEKRTMLKMAWKNPAIRKRIIVTMFALCLIGSVGGIYLHRKKQNSK